MDKYISREELIEEIEEEIEIGDKFDEKDVLINKGLKIALKYVKRQPSADVQPVVHGRWIKKEPRVLKCSVCGEYAPMNYLGQNCIDSRYCPDCGARMDGVEE